MRFKRICFTSSILILACTAFSQECPKVKGEKVAVQYLLDKKANNTEADRYCVAEAFETLSFATRFRNRNYIKFLVGMLDFERWTPGLTNEAGEDKYPAMNVLVGLQKSDKNVIPHLINGIKESDSDVLRTNATETLGEINYCMALKVLAQEAERTDIPYEQKLRLEAAEKNINDWDPSRLIWSCTD